MFDELCAYLRYPPIYTRDESSFWVDEHISKQLLATHLDLDDDLASRKPAFLNRSADWISQAMPPAQYPSLLDLGCGPGLYAQRFARMGYDVTGVDFSRRSIDYARKTAGEMNLPITYFHENYLEWEPQQGYDAAVLIYCDYCALSMQERKTVLNKVCKCLRPGGRFLMDVSTMKEYDAFKESRTWEVQEGGGFWSAEPYICLNACKKYEDSTALNQNIVMTEKGTKVYYIWHHSFTKESLAEETEAAGFKTIGLYDDVAGAPYTGEGRTMAAILEKQR